IVAGPTVPPPPALLSIAIGWPSTLEALSAIARMVRSVDPPAGHGTIRVIGLVGYSCAPAAAEISMPTAATANIKRLRLDISKLSLAIPLAAEPVVLSHGLNLPRKRRGRKAHWRR